VHQASNAPPPPVPAQRATPPSPPLSPRKSSRRTLAIFLLFLLIIGGGCTAAYYLFLKPDKPPELSDVPQPNKTSDEQESVQTQQTAETQPNQQTVSLPVEESISSIPDGIYRGSASGSAGPITVEVKILDGKIVAIEVLEHDETSTYFIESYPDIPEQIIATQSLDVDIQTGATQTAEGIVNAVRAALAGIR